VSFEMSTVGASARTVQVSFEFFPPKTEAMEQTLWQAIRKLEPLRPGFVSITYGAGGSTRERTQATVQRVLAETRLTPAAHLTCVAATRPAVDEVIRAYWDSGVRHIVALRGDPPAGPGTPFTPQAGGYESSVALVRGIRAIAPFQISVACYPEPHPEARSPQDDLEMLRRKVEAGADRAISNSFFDADCFLRFRDRAVAAGIEVPIVPGIMPIANFRNNLRFARKTGVTVPDSLLRLFEDLDDDPDTARLVAAKVAAELCLRLRAEGIDTFHFFTLNRPDLVYATCHMLGLRARLPAPESGIDACTPLHTP
jgi:methylenetetrahydrofolate reductase (NADPH)